MTLCQRCNKREAITVIGGRKLCEYCARDEIVKRIRKEMYESEKFAMNDRVLIIIDDQFYPLLTLLNYLLGKACYKCKLQIEYTKISTKENEGINDVIWKMIISAKGQPHKIKVLPFTSDFLLAYLIYSLSIKDSNYLTFTKPLVEFDNNLFFIPLYSTSTLELKGFAEYKFVWKDEMFNKIYEWVISNLKENYELFHTFHVSINLFNKKSTCKNCNAFIDGAEYCQRCSKILTSLSLPY